MTRLTRQGIPGVTPSALEQAVTSSARLRPNTKRMYLVAVRAFTTFAGADPRRWSGDVAVRWRDHLLKRENLVPKSVNAKLAALKFAFKRAVALKYLPDDMAAVAETLPYDKARTRRAVGREVAARMLATCDSSPRGIRDRAILTAGFFSGMRRESIAKLDFSRLDLRRQRMTIWIKGGRWHELPIDPRVAEALQSWIDEMRRRFKAPARGQVFRSLQASLDPGGYLLGEALTPGSIWRIVRERAELAGVGNFHPHLMRHCFISWAWEDGATIEQIMAITGHRSPSTVLEYRIDTGSAGPYRGLVKKLR